MAAGGQVGGGREQRQRQRQRQHHGRSGGRPLPAAAGSLAAAVLFSRFFQLQIVQLHGCRILQPHDCQFFLNRSLARHGTLRGDNCAA